MQLNRIYHGDMFELIKQVKDDSIDLIVCDGPYGITENRWDKIPGGIQQFNLNLLQLFSKKVKTGGAVYLFGKADCIDLIDYRQFFHLKRKIVWYQPSRLGQGRSNYTNNYDIVCYFTKGAKAKTFNLDAIRVPQLVELTHRKRCEAVPSVTAGKWGKTRFAKSGKNPGDVWGDIKQLTYRSKELVCREMLHTIQKPLRLIERMVLASSNEGELVLDPFAGVGTCPVVCQRHNRNWIAFERNQTYVNIGEQRLAQAQGLRQDTSNAVKEITHTEVL